MKRFHKEGTIKIETSNVNKKNVINYSYTESETILNFEPIINFLNNFIKLIRKFKN